MSREILYFNGQKYGNKSCRCHTGHHHDSVFEAEYCDQLALEVRGHLIKGYVSQVPYELKVNGVKICTHVVDFEVMDENGDTEIHEVKGFATEVWQLKYKLFKAIYPDIPYKIITRDYNASRNKYHRPRRRRTY